MDFKLWSELNPKAKKELKPDFGFRGWNSLSEEEKNKIWHYLNWFFFDDQIKEKYIGSFKKIFYEFYGNYKEKEYKQKTIRETISYINENFKAKSFADTYLKNPILNAACYDFYNIFMKQDEAVTIELLSAYAKFFYEFTKNDDSIYKTEKETEKEFSQRKLKSEFEYFDVFSERLNDVFLQFGIKYYLTRDGFVPRQENKIMEEIYEPVVDYLSNKKWKKVNEILSDSFTDYRRNTPQGYSNCVTNTISAIQAFLQIIVNGKTGKGKISELIQGAQKKNLIPNDFFTQRIFDNIESIFARQRQKTGIAHPKKEYATEKNARIILNLAMIFLQHCIQK